jgi:hypothetical protein
MTTAIEQRALGSTGLQVFPLALGCMGMSGMYGPADERESVATIHAALDAGVGLLDTGDFYGMGHNEMLVGRAIQGRRDKVLVSVKFGALRGPDGSWLGYDARPAAVKNFLAHSLSRLGVDRIDIYRPARLDPQVPIEDTIGAISDMVNADTFATSGFPKWGWRPSAAPTPCTPSSICKSNIRSSAAARKPPSSPFCPSSASASPLTACFRVACSAVRSQPAVATFAIISRASPARI